MTETDGTDMYLPLSLGSNVSDVSHVARTALYSSSTDDESLFGSDPILDTALPLNTKSVTPPVTKAHETLWFETEGLDHINGSLFGKDWEVKENNGLLLSPSNK